MPTRAQAHGVRQETDVPSIKGLIPIIGGLFMILMALNVLGDLPFLRHLQVGAPKSVVKKIRSGKNGPFILGLLTGLMPCGPLQMAEMYVLPNPNGMSGSSGCQMNSGSD